MRILNLLCLVVAFATKTYCSDITPIVFGDGLNGLPAAFGDFDSDELTDVFVIKKNGKTVEILLAADQEPLLRSGHNLSCSFRDTVTNVVPGDFDGDVFMDALVVTYKSGIHKAYILWGGNGRLNCTDDSEPLIEMRGQPLAIDYNQDMIVDLFGTDTNHNRVFWVFNQNRTAPTVVQMNGTDLEGEQLLRIREPHSNAFLDLDKDFIPDLVVTTERHFEIWQGTEKGFIFSKKINLPFDLGKSGSASHIGQSLYLDVELTGKMDLVLPICFDKACKNSTIMIYSNDKWHNLPINFRDNDNVLWGFVPNNDLLHTDAITLHGGDFNMDGYPDLLATLRSGSNQQTRSFLLQNVACANCAPFSRTYEVRWKALSPFFNETVMAVFYDFYQDGILDVILVERNKNNGEQYRTTAFKNSLDYDANFVKVMVLTGLTNSMYPISPGSLGRKKRTYGTNLPGPSISYKTTTQDGSPRSAIAAQLPQSAHFSLNLPYSTFGLGRTPNFVDTLIIGVSGKSREWPQIIPNSQMVVIPNPITDPSRWKAQLFVTPSKLILLSGFALTTTCIFILMIIFGLHLKERREDKLEKLQEAHRFHFDAM